MNRYELSILCKACREEKHNDCSGKGRQTTESENTSVRIKCVCNRGRCAQEALKDD